MIGALSEKAITTVISVVVSAVVGAVISFYATRRAERKSKVAEIEKRQTALENGTKALLRAEIIRNYDKYMERQWIPIYSKEALMKCYRAYADLGGNGVVKGLVSEMDKLSNIPVEGVISDEDKL